MTKHVWRGEVIVWTNDDGVAVDWCTRCGLAIRAGFAGASATGVDDPLAMAQNERQLRHALEVQRKAPRAPCVSPSEMYKKRTSRIIHGPQGIVH